MKLIDACLRCCLSQEYLAQCIGMRELLGLDYQVIFKVDDACQQMDAKSTKPDQHKAASHLEHN